MHRPENLFVGKPGSTAQDEEIRHLRSTLIGENDAPPGRGAPFENRKKGCEALLEVDDLRADDQIEEARNVRPVPVEKVRVKGLAAVESGVVAGHGEGQGIVVRTEHTGPCPLE